jgi:hypothetical protein
MHDPGGKTKISLPGGVRGSAEFSDCGRYRPMLSREWSPAGETPRAVLFVGLNPSIAGAEVSDPTCHRELMFAQSWGYTRYLKGNVMDWRATVPTDLPKEANLAASARNLPALREMSREAELIVMASGNVHKRFSTLEAQALDLLRRSGKPIMCLGKNKNGSAKHPLYLRKDTALQPF